MVRKRCSWKSVNNIILYYHGILITWQIQDEKLLCETETLLVKECQQHHSILSWNSHHMASALFLWATAPFLLNKLSFLSILSPYPKLQILNKILLAGIDLILNSNIPTKQLWKNKYIIQQLNQLHHASLFCTHERNPIAH